MISSLRLLTFCGLLFRATFADSVSIQSCGAACSNLSLLLPAQVFPVTDGAYYWAQQAAEIKPACYVRPLDASGVAAVVKEAQSAQCPFAIRGGGHSDVPGASNSPGGITLDLGALREITLSKDKKSVALGPGLSWGNVYSVLDPLNLTVVGGREASVGVAGLTLGGGLSYFSNLYGFACDNVKSFEVVLSSGQIVVASHHTNASDLYRALRGGGNNFGVVTRFELFTKPQGLMYGGLTVYSDNPGVAVDINRAFTYAIANSASDPAAHVFISLAHTANSYTWAAGLYNANPNPPFPIFNRFHSEVLNKSQSFSTEAVTTLTAQAEELDLTQPSGLRDQFHTATFRLDTKLAVRCFQIFREEVARITQIGLVNTTDFAPVFAIQGLSSPFLSHQAQRGGNVFGLDNSPRMVISTAWPWVDSADDKAVIGSMQRVIQRCIAAAKAMGLFDEYIYMNYAAPADRVVPSYGAENGAFLRQVSQKYDPHGVFQKLVPGGFKLE